MQQVTEKYINFASIIDEQTLEQNKRTAAMPFIFPHLASMPDAHLGKGCAVGSVLPTDGAIIPVAVGVDIGCGMIAVRTQFLLSDVRERDRKPLRTSIERAVPMAVPAFRQPRGGEQNCPAPHQGRTGILPEP